MTKSDDHTKERVRTWIDIDTKAIAKNYRVFRKFIGKKTKMLGMVKSNAYGHNLVEYSKELEKLGIDWLGVDSLIEGIRLRENKVRIPILVLGYTLPAMYEDARNSGIAITLSSFDQLETMLALRPSKKKLHVHVKVDTGMHRQGFQWKDSALLIGRLLEAKTMRAISIEGLYTHLAEAKNPRSGDNTRAQLAQFKKWKHLFIENNISVITHAGATGGTLLYPDSHFDMVRVGIGLYGLWPSAEVQRVLEKKITLVPSLSWKAVVSEVKDVPMGDRIGYDLTEMFTRDSRVAIIPIGYWHGFKRALSSKGRVLIHGKSARVLGRVSMDMIAVDVTDIPRVKMGDVAVVIGKSGKEEITAGELARFVGTTHYEIVTTINPLIKKFFVYFSINTFVCQNNDNLLDYPNHNKRICRKIISSKYAINQPGKSIGRARIRSLSNARSSSRSMIKSFAST